MGKARARDPDGCRSQTQFGRMKRFVINDYDIKYLDCLGDIIEKMQLGVEIPESEWNYLNNTKRLGRTFIEILEENDAMDTFADADNLQDDEMFVPELQRIWILLMLIKKIVKEEK